jgi:uncharacterized protein with von Willebrand factor type A (vWA) domain
MNTETADDLVRERDIAVATCKELEAEVERLRAALQQIATGPQWDPANQFLADDMARCARRALGEREP